MRLVLEFICLQMFELSTVQGTKEEVRAINEKCLQEFKAIKDVETERYRKTMEISNTKSDYAEKIYIEYVAIADKQYNLELNTGVGMINSRTKNELTQNVNMIHIYVIITTIITVISFIILLI